MSSSTRDLTPSAPAPLLWTRRHAARESWGRMRRSRSGMTGLVILALLTVTALFASLIGPFDPNSISDDALASPSGSHLMGTDNIGRDIFSVVVHGARVALLMGVLSATLALVIGALVGGVAGFVGGRLEAVIMRITEMFQILPLMVLVLFVVALWGSHLWLLIAAVAIAIWPLEARIVYGQVRALREREFVQVARVAGMPPSRILVREILPNALPPVIVQVSLDAGLAILIQTGLGFLGLGDPDTPSWGQLLYTAQSYLSTAWWMSVFPGIAVALTVVAFSLLGDGLNEVYNPRQLRVGRGGTR